MPYSVIVDQGIGKSTKSPDRGGPQQETTMHHNTIKAITKIAATAGLTITVVGDAQIDIVGDDVKHVIRTDSGWVACWYSDKQNQWHTNDVCNGGFAYAWNPEKLAAFPPVRTYRSALMAIKANV